MTTVAEILGRRDRAWTLAAWVVLAGSVLGSAVYLLHSSTVVATTVLVTIAAVTVGSIVVGIAVHRPNLVLPWQLVTVASGLFLVGGLGRVMGRQGLVGWEVTLAPVATLAGYATVGAAAAVWLHARATGTGAAAALDAALVGLAVALVIWTVLVAPVGAASTVSDGSVLLETTYPIIDAILLTVLVQLVFTSATGDRSFVLLTSCLVLLLVGDLGYAVNTVGLVDVPGGLRDVPFLLGYGALAAAALHPSMAHVASNQPRQVYVGRRRLPGLVVGVVAAVTILFLAPADDLLDRSVRGVLFGVLLLGILLRSEGAVRRHAAGERDERHRSTHDGLTGLPNRVLLRERVAQRLAEATGVERVSLLFIDLDGFKFVNDFHGHTVGDELLVQAARRLRGVTRSDDVVARYGGDEFVIVVALDRAATEGLADRVVATFSEPFSLAVGSVFVSASIGIARSAGPAATSDVDGTAPGVDELIQQADTAMYQAKARGRGGYARYDDSLRERARLQVETSTALRHALAREEFEVFYQPMVDLRDGRTLGWEALLRWNRDGEELSPAVFVPIAETSDIIVPIGAWVLRTACTQLAAWRREHGLPLHVSVNLSARQLRDTSLAATVADVLAETGLPGDALWLELTETALVDDPASALEVLDELAALGVVICLDDFGTGYSALGYLQRFPVSVVKIDGSFVAVLDEGDPGSTVAGAVQSMAGALGLRTVAEGVETELQEQQLRRLGCHLVQGYRYGYPVPAHQVPLAPRAPRATDQARVPAQTVAASAMDPASAAPAARAEQHAVIQVPTPAAVPPAKP